MVRARATQASLDFPTCYVRDSRPHGLYLQEGDKSFSSQCPPRPPGPCVTRPTTFCLPVFPLSLHIWLQGPEPSTDPQTHQAWCCLRAFALTVATHWNFLSRRTARFSPFPLSLHSAVIFSASCL